MKKLFALIFAAVLFAGCSNNVDNNDAAKFALFSRQNNTEKYSLKINLFAEQSRTITPFDSDEAYVNAVSKVEKWDLVFTDINDESNNFSISQLQAKNGVLLVETEKTGNFKVEISGSIEIDGTKYNFYGLIPSVGLSDTPGETLEFSAPVGLAKAGGKGNFSGKVTLDEYWKISNKEFSEGGVPDGLFKISLVSKTNNEKKFELTPEYDSITDQSGFFTGFAFNKNDIPSDYYQLKVSFSEYNGKKSVDEVVFDKGNLVVIGDGLTTHAELLACYSQPVTQIVDTYYACNDKDSQGNGLYPQTKGYAWGIIKNIFEYTEKEAGTYTVYCDDFVIDAVEYKALKGISSKNGVVNILYSNGKCTIEYNNDTDYKLSVERCFAVSAKDFVVTEAEPFPVLEIDEHNTKNLYTSVTYENFVAVVLKSTNFAAISPRDTKINYYINDTETFLYNTPFFVYNSDPEFTSFEQNYALTSVYIKRNGEYQYAPSYRLRLFTDDNPMPEGYKKLYETDPDAAANYKQFYLSVKPSVQFIDPEQKYFIGSDSKTEGDYIIYAPENTFQVYADYNCENPVNDDKLTYTWYLNGKDVSAITGNNSFVVLSEEYDDLNLYGENNIECIITDGSIMKTADKTFKFSMPVEQRAALYYAKDSQDYSILKYYNTVSGMTYNTNIKIKDVKDYYTTWFFMDGTSLFYEEVDSVGSVTYRTQALNGEFVEMPFNDSLEGLISSLNKQNSLNSLTKDVATGKIWLYHSDDTEKRTRLSVIENPNDEDCKVISYAMLDSYDPGACIAVYNDKVYVFRTTNEIDIYSAEKNTRNGLKLSAKPPVNTGIPLENENGKLFENPRVMDFAVVPYNGGVRAVVCISQIFDNKFTPEDFTQGSTHKMYSLGSVSSFDLDESGNISNLKSNLGYNKSETGNQDYNYKDYDNNSINYQINFIVSDSEEANGMPVIFGKTKILAIKEDEVILSDVGVYSDVDADKKRLRRKSHLVKYDFNKLYDLESDVNISFDIKNSSESLGEWHTDIWE